MMLSIGGRKARASQGMPAAVLAAIVVGAASLSGCESLPKSHPPTIQSPASCADFSISIYFEPGSSVVTPEAQALIRSAAAHAQRCQVQGIDVVGLADAPGAPDANLQLSKDRAAAVTAALSAKGLDHIDINTTALGDQGAQAHGGELRPLRRRANVSFHLGPRPHS